MLPQHYIFCVGEPARACKKGMEVGSRSKKPRVVNYQMNSTGFADVISSAILFSIADVRPGLRLHMCTVAKPMELRSGTQQKY